jgi:hypothetical protein
MALHGTDARAGRTYEQRYGIGHAPRVRSGCRLHSPVVSESGGPTSPGPTNSGPTKSGPRDPGWFNDPAGRFEYRYHNGATWTSDVASNGQRYVDPVAPSGGPPVPSSTPPGHAANGSSNGIAVAALVCGIVSVVVGWIPVLFAIGAVLAVLAIIFGIVGIGRARTTGRRKGFAITGLVMGSIGVLAAAGGLVLTIVLFRAIDRYENPPESTASIESCVVDAGRARATGELRNDGTRSSRFTVYVEFRGLPSGPTIERVASVPSVRPGATAPFAVDNRFEADDVECEITAVNGPLPFGLEID